MVRLDMSRINPKSPQAMGDSFSTFDDMTVTQTLLPQPMAPRYSPGEPMDTVSMEIPMPGPTNSAFTMGGGEDCNHGRNCAGIGPVVYPLPRPIAEIRDKIAGNSAMGGGRSGASPASTRAVNENKVHRPWLLSPFGGGRSGAGAGEYTVQNSAEWKEPSYNYNRVKAAEESMAMNSGTVIGLGLLSIGLFGVIRMLGESFDESGLNIGGTPTP